MKTLVFRGTTRLLTYFFIVIAGSFIHTPEVHFFLLCIAFVLAKRRFRILWRVAVLLFFINLAVSLTAIGIAIWQSEPLPFAMLFLFNARTALFAFLGIWLLMPLNMSEMLRPFPNLRCVWELSLGQIAVYRRILNNFRLAFVSRQLGKASTRTLFYHAAAKANFLVDNAVDRALWVAWAMRSRGVFDAVPRLKSADNEAKNRERSAVVTQKEALGKTPWLEFSSVNFAWETPEENVGKVEKVPVFTALNFSIQKGEKVVLLGGNGSGKSTLLALANGLVFPAAGEVRWQGMPLSRRVFQDAVFARAFRRANALLFQQPDAMLFNPSVGEEIAYGPRQLGLPDTEDRARHWAAEFQLTAQFDAAPHTLSGGQKQKLALACLFALDPGFFALDEPTASLDLRTVGWLIDALLDSGKTLLISTHHLSLATELGDRALLLGTDGRLLADDALDKILADTSLLESAGLAHRHRHRHGNNFHDHAHRHDG